LDGGYPASELVALAWPDRAQLTLRGWARPPGIMALSTETLWALGVVTANAAGMVAARATRPLTNPMPARR
jgi:hypothetical protein